MRRLLLFLLFSIAVLAVPSVGSAQDGFIVCGGEGDSCKFCDIFTLVERIYDFVLFPVVPTIGTILVLYGGFLFLTAQGNPSRVSQAKNVFQALVIGLIIVYGAWLLIHMVLGFLGVAEWTGLQNGWWTIPCD